MSYKILQFYSLSFCIKFTLTSPSTYFKNLDSIRFAAALMVVLSHIVSPIYSHLQVPQFVARFLYTISYGGTGVSIFFVLSGFLITTLLIEEKNTKGSINLYKFYVRRSLRIWPLYFAVIVFAFGIYPLIKNAIGVNQSLATNVWYHISFLANFDVLHVREFFTGQDAMSQNVNWSISIEEQFYVFWPLLFAFSARKLWPYLITAVLLCGIVFRFVHNDSFDLLYFHTFAVMPDLALGALAAALCSGSNKTLLFFQKQNDFKQLSVFVVLFLLLYFSTQLATPGYMPALHRLLVDLLVAYLVCSQAYSTSALRFTGSNWKFGSRWGKYTYGIYLLHPVALLFVNICLRFFQMNVNDLPVLFIQALVSVALTFLLSFLSYRYFESYFLRLKQKFAA